MLRYAISLLLVLLSFASLALAQGAAPAPPFAGWWDARWSGLKANDSVTDQTAQLAAAKLKAKQLARPLYVVKGVYNAGLTLDSTYDGFTIILGGDVKIKQAWHLAGNGRDLDGGDANYSTTASTTGSNYVTDVTITGGRLILGTGGRLGTFYAKRINIWSPIYGEALCAGVHVYSHTHGIAFSSMWFDGTGSVSSYEAPFWADPFSASADSSQPSDISIGDYYVASAYRYGLNLSARNVFIGRAYIKGATYNGLRFYSALTNAGTVDTCRASNLTINQLTVQNCGGSGSATNDHLYAGVLFDSYANDASVQFMDISGSAENALKIYNAAHNINIERLRADSNQTNTADNPTTRYVVHIQGTSTRNIHIGDAFIRKAVAATGSNAGGYGLVIDGARDVTIGKVVAREGFRTGVLVNNTYQNVHIGQIYANQDTNGVAFSGDYLGPLVVDDIFADSCYTYGINLGGTSVGNVIDIGTALINGKATSGSSDAGLNINSIAGSVHFDRLQARNYTTGGYGVFVQPNSTGDVVIAEMLLDSNATGIDWSKGTTPSTDNNKFTFGKVSFVSNTTNWDSDFRTDRLLNIGTIEGAGTHDTTMICGYPINLDGLAPTDGYALVFNSADSSFHPEAIAAGGTSVDLTVAGSGGVINSTPALLYVGHASNGAMVTVANGTVGYPLKAGGAGNPPSFGLLGVAGGGTGATTLTDGGLLVGAGTSAITALGVATNGQIPIGDGTTAPALGTITGVANETDVTNGAGSITIGLVDPLSAAKGGTGAATLTNHGVLLGQATSAIAATSAGTAGQFLISNGSAADPGWQTLQPMANGGTNAALTASNGAIPYSTASAFALLAPGTSGYYLKSNGAAAPSWSAVSGTADGSGVWDSAASTPRSDISLIPTANDTALRITTGSNITTLATDLTVPRSLVLSSNGGITLSGGSVINQFQDSSEVENAAGTGKGWWMTRFAPGDSGRFLWPPATGTSFTDTWANGKFLKFSKVGSTTAPDSANFVSIDAATDLTGVLPAANGGLGTAMTNGQLPIGDGSGVPTMATISNGTGTTVNNGAGTISIDATLGTSVTLTSEVTGVLPIANGGTNNSSALTDGGLLLGGASVTALGVATNGQIPIGDGTTAPVLATVTGTANEVDVTNGAGSITIGLVDPLTVAKGGLGAATQTDGAILLGAGTGAVTNTGVLANGTLIVGDGTTAPTLLGIGANTYVLTSNGTTAGWAAPSGGGGGSGILLKIDSSNGAGAGTLFTADSVKLYGDNSIYFRYDSVTSAFDSASIGVRLNGTTLSKAAGGLQVATGGITTQEIGNGYVHAADVDSVSTGGDGPFKMRGLAVGQHRSAAQATAMNTDSVLTLCMEQGTTDTTILVQFPRVVDTSADKGKVLALGTSTGSAGVHKTQLVWTTMSGGNGINDGVGFNIKTMGGTLADTSIDLVAGTGITVTGDAGASPNTVTFATTLGTSVDSAEIVGTSTPGSGAVTGAHQRYRRVVYALTNVHLRNTYATTDSLTVSLNEMNDTSSTTNRTFNECLFYDSTNKASQPDDSIYVIGTIPEDMLADSLYIVYRTNNATYTSTGGIQDIQWYYSTADMVQQPGSGTATGSSNAVNLASQAWSASKTSLAGVTLTAGTRFKVRLILDFTADNTTVRIASVAVMGRRR